MSVPHRTLPKYILKQPCCNALPASVFQALILLPSSMLYQTHCGNDLLPEGVKKKIVFSFMDATKMSLCLPHKGMTFGRSLE